MLAREIVLMPLQRIGECAMLEAIRMMANALSAQQASSALAMYGDVEGGYYVRSSINRYLGHAFPTESTAPLPLADERTPRRSSDPPANEHYSPSRPMRPTNIGIAGVFLTFATFIC